MCAISKYAHQSNQLITRQQRIELHDDIYIMTLTGVGFEPTQFSLVELESTSLDHSGKLSMLILDVDHDD